MIVVTIRHLLEITGLRSAVDWAAAIWAGLAAGVLSTLAQVLMWWIFADSVPETLFRDARLTAAILMGPEVLPPPASFDPVVMLVATCIHFALSIVYGVLLAFAIRRLRWAISLSAGALFGLALYTVNLYGFTVLFPWFAEVRDGITLAAHLVFGLAAAGTYKVLACDLNDL